MPYISYPNSYVVIVQESQQKFGYIVIKDKAIDCAGYLQAEEFRTAITEVKKILKRKKLKLPIYRDLKKEYLGYFEGFTE